LFQDLSLKSIIAKKMAEANKKGRTSRPGLALPYYLERIARTMDAKQRIWPLPYRNGISTI